MRFPVFARRTNPSIDKPILRKKLGYLEEQVLCGRADWIDPLDKRKGIIARELLPIYERPVETINVSQLRSALPSLESHGTQFDDPEQNISKRQDRMCLIVRARAFARLAELQTA